MMQPDPVRANALLAARVGQLTNELVQAHTVIEQLLMELEANKSIEEDSD